MSTILDQWRPDSCSRLSCLCWCLRWNWRTGDILVIDTPGQVELFAFREASSHLVEVLGQGRASLAFLFDPMLSQTPSGFVSQMLLFLVHLDLAFNSQLSFQTDLLEPGSIRQNFEWGENLDVLEAARRICCRINGPKFQHLGGWICHWAT